MERTLSLYIHIPFCRRRCSYCDFNTYVGLEGLFSDYVRAVATEIVFYGSALQGPKVATIFFGGGTPTVLSPEVLGAILAASHQAFRVCGDAEVTVEANPGTVDVRSLARLRELGVNRLSLGIQSFDESELCLLGRLHTRDEAITAYRMAREAGFDNVNLDLIFGLPNQPIAAWRTTLDWAIDLGPEHLSAYALTVEEGTPLAGQIARGELLNPDPDIAAEMYALAEEALAAAGYVHYEISNWARPGFECRHNLTYWYNHPYLGVGAGAHSWLAGRRWSNVLAPADYIARMVATWNSHPYAPVVAEVEEISAALEMGETMMLGLRLAEGVKFSQFRQRFGLEMQEVYNKEIRELRESGLVEVDSASVRLTARGWLLGNQVFARFLP